MSSRSNSGTIDVPSNNHTPLLLFLFFELCATHLSVKFKPEDIFQLQTQLSIIIFLLLATLRLQLQWNLELILESIDMMFLYRVPLESLMPISLWRFHLRKVSLKVVNAEYFVGLQSQGRKSLHLDAVFLADRLLDLVISVDIQLASTEGMKSFLNPFTLDCIKSL